MKKTLLVLSIILSATCTVHVLYAGDARYIGSISGEDSSVVVSIDTSDVKDFNKEIHQTDTFTLHGDEERLHQSLNFQDIGTSTFTTAESLIDYCKILMYKNIQIETIAVGRDDVSITRKSTSKLFSVIPVPIQETITVVSLPGNTSQVTVVRSWWGMFSKNTVISNEVSADITMRINTIPSSLFVQPLAVTTKVRILTEIESVFEKSNDSTYISK